ncbi:MAG: hypothetical protein WCV00_11580 [Verrucomicrobiia bacterium]|jgi:hypothetical protein
MKTSTSVLFAFCLVAQTATSQPAIVIKNDYAEFAIGGDGNSMRFADRRAGVNYCDPKAKAPFARVKKGGKEFGATAVTYERGVLTARFGEAGVTAAIKVTTKGHYFVFEVKELQGDGVEEFAFVDLPLTLKGQPDEPFAACALALNLQTNVRELPGPNRRLRASCYPRFGFAGAKVALVACPQKSLRAVMKEVVSAAPELPRSRIGGPWALDSINNYGSYLFNSSDMSEEKVDNWIRLAQSLGITQIDFHGGQSFRFGDCHPNPKTYPRGRASFKAVIDKLHKAGILAGLHTYAFFMAKNCPWVTPVPDPRLGKDATFTLAAPLEAAATAVPVEESTEKMSNVTGFFVRNSVTLQVDDELITYSDVLREPPYGFTKCKRGAHGTRVAAHAKGAKVHHLRECFGLFVPDGDSTLLTDVAAKTAEMFNECGFDMIYLDALDGEDVIAGAANGWHYGSKFTFEICKRLKRPAIMEMSTFHHHLWFVRARMGAWDHPTRSHKKFIDIHCAGNESCRRMFLPAHLGWWAFKTWTGPQGEPTFADDIEYLCAKALANDCGLSVMGITPENAPKTPALPRLAAIVKRYEELRRAKCFSKTVKEKLRVPGDEFTLVEQPKGKPQFCRVQYDKHKVLGLDGWSNEWKTTNKFSRQPLQLRIEALMSAGPYDAPGNITLADFADTSGFAKRVPNPAISAKLEPSSQCVKVGKVSGCYTAASKMTTRQGAWSNVGKTFSPPANLTGHEALGVWVHGDGKGEVLNLQLKSPSHLSHADGDHYITVDFTGWRYFELVEPEGQRHADYTWPYGGIYSIYRESIRPASIESLNLYFNNLPPKETATCYLSPVRALPTLKAKLRNPSVTLGGKTITFPVEIESGQYLEFRSPSDCKLYGPTGEVLGDVTPQGDAPVLEPGDSQLRFTCEPPAGLSPRAHVSVISHGELVGK